MKIRNTFIIFIVSGFWHGANWTFIVWGALNAIYFLPLLLTNNNRNNLEVVAKGKLLPSLKEVWAMSTTFLLTVLAWIFFRAENLGHALTYISDIFSSSLFTIPEFDRYLGFKVAMIFVLLIFFLIIEWMGRENEYAIEGLRVRMNKRVYRWSFYLIIWSFIFIFSGNEQEFIYFQF